jgi:branched-chain amino acid transport system substrate-binding protein
MIRWFGVAMVAAALVLTGCSSGSAPSSPSGVVKVTMISNVASPIFGTPEVVPTIAAFKKMVNDSGGINGAKLEVTLCNDQGNGVIGTKCAESAIADGNIAVLDGVTIVANAFLPTLQASHIAWVSGYPVNPLEYSNPTSFAVTTGTLGYAGAAYQLVKQGCKRVGVIEDDGNAADKTDVLFRGGAEAAGGTVSGVQKFVSGASPDLTAVVQSILETKPDCLALGVSQTELVSIVQAVKQSSKPDLPIGTVYSTVTPATLKQMGSEAKGMVLTSSNYVAPVDATNTRTFIALMSPYGTQNMDAYAEAAYSSLSVFVDVAKTVKGRLTAASFFAAMSSVKGLKIPTIPGALTVKDTGIPGFERVFNFDQVVYQAVGDGSIKYVGVVDSKTSLQRAVALGL